MPSYQNEVFSDNIQFSLPHSKFLGKKFKKIIRRYLHSVGKVEVDNDVMTIGLVTLLFLFSAFSVCRLYISSRVS